jgi:hypothetical protein
MKRESATHETRGSPGDANRLRGYSLMTTAAE